MRARALLPTVAFPLAAAPAAQAAARVGSLPQQQWPVSNPPHTETLIVLGVVLVVSGIAAVFLMRLVYLKVRATLADARLELAEKRARIAAVPLPPTTRSGSSLTLTEISQVLEHMPEVTPELKAAICTLLDLRLKERRWPVSQ